MNLKGEQRADWDSLLRVIATRSNLGKVRLEGANYSGVERQTPAALIRAFLQAIQQNTAIQNVMLWGLRLPTDISTFVDNASSITSFCIDGCDMEAAERQQGASDLAAALQRNTNIETLSLEKMENIYTVPILESLRLNAAVKNFIFFSGPQVHGNNIISILSRPDSPLRCFEFHGSLEAAFPDVQFENLLRAVEKSKLGRFNIGRIETPQQLQTLTQTIPSMKLKELEVVLFCDDEVEDEPEGELVLGTVRQELLRAVKNNFSLQSVKIRTLDDFMEESDLFDSVEDKHRLAFYANRNKSLEQWVDHPEKVERKVWPDALGLAERAGPDALFRGLHLVLESDYVSLPGGRKRKRPQYYTPA